VIVRKKSGQIQLCVEFQDLSKETTKYNYPFPSMEMLLQQVFVSALMSMLEIFLGYNQVLVA